MTLQLRNIGKTYHGRAGDVRALDNVTLEVAPGEFVAVLGPSGCGKSTLLLVSGGLLAPDQGTVSIASQTPYSLGPEARARCRATQIGFVFQEFHLVPYLDVLDNVLVPSLAITIPNARRRALELLERFGMADRLHHVPGELSTGQRQRTALARALLAEPKLLLADEPTGNLDQENAERVWGYLAEFAQAGGAVLLVTHDAQAAGRADRCLSLDAGRLCEPQTVRGTS